MKKGSTTLYIILYFLFILIILTSCASSSKTPKHGQANANNLANLISNETLSSRSAKLAKIDKDNKLPTSVADKMIGSPCYNSLVGFLSDIYQHRDELRPVFEKINADFQNPPQGYQPSFNIWRAPAGSDALDEISIHMLSFFTDWCEFLPQIDGDQDNGLRDILKFSWFYYQNEPGAVFTQGVNPITNQPDNTLSRFLEDFSNQRGAFMDSAASTKYVAQWATDPRIEISDYIKQSASQYDSWNDFFSRDIYVNPTTGQIPSRPVTMPERSYVVVSPTDCIMNPLVQHLGGPEFPTPARQLIKNPLQLDTVIDVKNTPISLDRLLGNAPDALKSKFIGGSGLSCVLMPNTYHHFHSPVDGEILHAEVVKVGKGGAAGTYGYYDFPNWVPNDGNVGRPGTDFSQFEVFQRAVVIIYVRYTGTSADDIREGWVASIPVGLDTIGSVFLDPWIVKNASVTKGITRLGGFLYGGSLNIILFSKGIASPTVQTRLGNQINILNAGTTPK